MEECEKNDECKLCHKNVDKVEEVKWQGDSMDLSVNLSLRTCCKRGSVKIKDNTLIK